MHPQWSPQPRWKAEVGQRLKHSLFLSVSGPNCLLKLNQVPLALLNSTQRFPGHDTNCLLVYKKIINSKYAVISFNKNTLLIQGPSRTNKFLSIFLNYKVG